MYIYGFTGVILVLSYYYWNKNQRTKFYYKDNALNRELLQKCTELNSYNPTKYLNGFLQTIFASIIKPKEFHETIREEINLKGMSVDWIDKGKGIDEQKPLLFIMPGLTGSVKDGYINSIVSEAHAHGFHNICVYNYRLLAKNPDLSFKPDHYNYGLNMTPQPFKEEFKSDGFYGEDNDFYYFHPDVVSGKRLRIDLPADLHYTLEYLQNKYKFTKIVAIGCSYGGVQLSAYLGRFQEKALVNAGVTVCSPHSMIIACSFLTYTMDYALTRILQSKVGSNPAFRTQKLWPTQLDAAMNTNHIREFDSNFTSIVFGHHSVDAYYRHFSPCLRFKNIKVPMLCISSLDDGVCHPKSLCIEEMILNEKTIMCVTPTGGHVGFLEGWNMSSIWFPRAALQYLSYLVDNPLIN